MKLNLNVFNWSLIPLFLAANKKAELISVQVCSNVTTIYWEKTLGICNEWVCVAF